ncbi:MAG: tetratricopeptide repeat protein [Melioribacteraceae bacterium]
MKQNNIYCSKCGAENKPTDNFCSKCGTTLNKSQSSQSGSQTIISPSKKLPITTILYSAGALFVIGFIVLYSAGIFDSTPATVVNNTQNFDDVHKGMGVDLKSIERINLLEGIVKNNPTDKNTIAELAHLLNDSGFKEKAIEKYKQYLALDPKNADMVVDMGVCYFELGRDAETAKNMEETKKYYDLAIGNFMDALKITPKHQIAHYNLGIVKMSSGKFDEAKEWWKKTIEINPNAEVAKNAKELLESH